MKEMYVRVPTRLITSAFWITALDVVLTGVAWFWAEGWNVADFWHHQVRGKENVYRLLCVCGVDVCWRALKSASTALHFNQLADEKRCNSC